jgi:DNA-binding NtrC family response regulator
VSDRSPSSTVEIRVPARNYTWILEVQDDGPPRRVPFVERAVVGASAREAGVVLHDRRVSARHCALRALGGGIEIVDLGSRNGTFVGGARVERAWAGPGTTLTLGRSSVVLVACDGDDDEGAGDPQPLPSLAGGSRAMRRVAAQVRRLARMSAPVLVAGESGTGKELVARALHDSGPRREQPFVVINVAALPRELVESEMFGHERGAFTGAHVRRSGAFEQAEGGTLFLDEIGDLPLEAQPKLLRALDGYEVRRVGAEGTGQRCDARVVAATHVALEERVARAEFRRDLFHRLEVFVIDVPPLRARPGDVAPLARALLARAEPELGPVEITSAGLARLAAHAWPGNVRELRNVLYRAADAARGPVVDAVHVERVLRARRTGPVELSSDLARAWLERCDGNMSAAARAAGLPRTTFRKLLLGGASGSVPPEP